MSLPARLLGANPSVQVSSLLTGDFAVPSAKLAYAEPIGYEALSSYLVPNGGLSEVEFAGIPTNGKYKNLQIRIYGRTSSSVNDDGIAIRFNGDTGSNYSYQTLYGNSSSAIHYGEGSSTKLYADKLPGSSATANAVGGIIVNILDFNDTNKYTTIRTLGGSDRIGAGVIHFSSGTWLTTSAVHTIKLFPTNSGNFNQYSRISLYGIRG